MTLERFKEIKVGDLYEYKHHFSVKRSIVLCLDKIEIEDDAPNMLAIFGPDYIKTYKIKLLFLNLNEVITFTWYPLNQVFDLFDIELNDNEY